MSRGGGATNNIRKLRLAFLLTPAELARLMRAEPSDVERIEAQTRPLAEEWIRSVSRALGILPEFITAPDISTSAVRAMSTGFAEPPNACPIAARYAISAILAKFGGAEFAARIDPDDLARLIQNFYDFVENDRSGNEKSELNRRRLALQITVLTFLQSRDFEPGQTFQTDLAEATAGALALMDRFSMIGRAPEEQ